MKIKFMIPYENECPTLSQIKSYLVKHNWEYVGVTHGWLSYNQGDFFIEMPDEELRDFPQCVVYVLNVLEIYEQKPKQQILELILEE